MTVHDDTEMVVKGDLHTIGLRGTMGLPEGYVSPTGEDVAALVDDVLSSSIDELVALVESETAPVERRLAAGVVLSLRGDPRCPDLDPVMVSVPAGTAKIGLDAARVEALHAKYRKYGVAASWLEKECPRFEVEVEAFALGRYPVTNSQYLAFLRATGSEHIPSSWAFGRCTPGAENQPVYTITTDAADEYAAWLAATTGRRFRLPTETEWEYAAAGPEGFDFPWGDDFRAECANTVEMRLLMTTPIGMFPLGASAFGALDMAGNVEEYVSTVYYPYPGAEIVEDDLWETLGYYRVARGGAFNHFQDLARCQRRHGPYPHSVNVMGLRIAEDVG